MYSSFCSEQNPQENSIQKWEIISFDMNLFCVAILLPSCDVINANVELVKLKKRFIILCGSFHWSWKNGKEYIIHLLISGFGRRAVPTKTTEIDHKITEMY